jgi:O-antigen/teichoic acid export membrane protein
MVFGVPISVALAGYLWAIGSASVPLRATALGIPAMAVILLPLLPLIGVVAVGLAYIAGALIESILFVHAAKRSMTLRIDRRLVVPVGLATTAGACGWFVARWIGPDLLGALSSSAVAVGVFISGLAAFQRTDLADAWRLVTRGLRGVMARPADARPQAHPQPAAG